MTFKHTKFQDSAVMRSLEKLAVQKGLVTPEPMTKVATATIVDLTPSTSLTQNVIKLCTGLRQQGLNTYADELEVHLLNYKRAQTLYETSPEKGEDLVEFAHPEGSHKLVGVEGDEAVVEDILDHQLKMLEVVNKKPTGKLSSKAAISAVKQVFAQDAANDAESAIDRNLNRALGILNQVGKMVKGEMSVFADFEMIANRIKKAATNPIVDNLDEMVSQFDALKTRIKPGSWVTLGLGGITENTWSTVEPLLNTAIRFVNAAKQLRVRSNQMQAETAVHSFEEIQPPPAAPARGPSDQLTDSFDSLAKNISLNLSRLSVVNVPNKDRMVKWLQQALAEVNTKTEEFKGNANKNDPIILRSYQQYYDTTSGQVKKVEQWVQQKAGA